MPAISTAVDTRIREGITNDSLPFRSCGHHPTSVGQLYREIPRVVAKMSVRTRRNYRASTFGVEKLAVAFVIAPVSRSKLNTIDAATARAVSGPSAVARKNGNMTSM